MLSSVPPRSPSVVCFVPGLPTSESASMYTARSDHWHWSRMERLTEAATSQPSLLPLNDSTTSTIRPDSAFLLPRPMT